MISSNYFYKRGFAIFEILVVFAILAVLFSVVIPQFSKTKENQILKSTVEDVLSSIDKARGKTLSSLNSSEYGVRFESNKIIIYKGKIFSAGAVDNETVNVASGAMITNVTLGGVSGISGDMYFNRLYGVPSAIGTVTVSTANYLRTITISATGVASVN